MIEPQAYAEHLLSARIWLESATAATFLPGFVEPPHVLSQSRLLLIAEGRLVYQVEDSQQEIAAGQMIFVPRLVGRQWSVPAEDPTGCLLLWFIFTTDPPEPLGTPEMVADVEDIAWEIQAFHNMARRSLADDRNGLANQADATAALVRFLARATVVPGPELGTRAHRSQRAVREVAQWLAENFDDPDALHGLHRRAHLSENYFREVFHRELGMNPRHYLNTLRMQAARFRLHEYGMNVQEAATSVGYNDPFHFSRSYRRFWGHPPSDDFKAKS